MEIIRLCSNPYKRDKMDCNNYIGISLLSTSYSIIPNIPLEKMTPYANEIIGYYQCVLGETD
jgi:hypothetical protein